MTVVESSGNSHIQHENQTFSHFCPFLDSGDLEFCVKIHFSQFLINYNSMSFLVL